MLKNIKNNITRFAFGGLVTFLFSTCQEQERNADAKIVTKKMTDGSIKAIGATINGKKEGLWINYDDSGWLSSHDTYINDSLTGETIGYFESGAILSKGSLKNGQREGEWIIYYDVNKPKSKGNYKNGYRVGIWEYYTEDGRLDKKVEYLKDGTKRILQDNHLTPPIPASMKPFTITDPDNNAIIK